MTTTFPVPQWVKDNEFVLYQGNGDRIVFQRQRKIVWVDGEPGLAAPDGTAYSLANCQPLKPWHLSQPAILLTETKALTLYRTSDRRLGDGFVVDDGDRRAGVKIPSQDVDRAAQALARMFAGTITVKEMIGDDDPET